MTESETKTEVTPVEDKTKEETAPAGAETATPAAANEEQQPPVKEMRAVVLTGFGGFKSVKIQKKPQPTPAEDEVLIKVRAT